MTKLITKTNNTPFGALQGFNHLPALFNESWLNDVLNLDKWDKAFEMPGVHYPYDISYVKDATGAAIEYHLDVALAGVGKDNIKLSVKDQHLIIEVSKNVEPQNSDSIKLKSGISYRNTKLQFKLDKDVNSKKITSSYKDGLLNVVIPVSQPEVTNIQIKVD